MKGLHDVLPEERDEDEGPPEAVDYRREPGHYVGDDDEGVLEPLGCVINDEDGIRNRKRERERYCNQRGVDAPPYGSGDAVDLVFRVLGGYPHVLQVDVNSEAVEGRHGVGEVDE